MRHSYRIKCVSNKISYPQFHLIFGRGWTLAETPFSATSPRSNWSPELSRSEAAPSKRLVRMVPGSARNWIAVNAVQTTNFMKKQQNNSTRAWALHVALSLALLSISAVLFAAANFKAAPATRRLNAPINPVAAGDRDMGIAGQPLAQSLSPADAPFTFSDTVPLNTARGYHTATLLPNGQVLVTGGGDTSGLLSSAELYDPLSGTWSATGSPNTGHILHTATLLPNGQVLVAGGRNNDGYLASAGTVRPGQREMDLHHRPPQHRTRLSHGDVAAQRPGAGGRRTK